MINKIVQFQPVGTARWSFNYSNLTKAGEAFAQEPELLATGWGRDTNKVNTTRGAISFGNLIVFNVITA